MELIKLLLRHKTEIASFFAFMGSAYFASIKVKKKIYDPASKFWDRLLKALKELENNGGGSLLDKVNKSLLITSEMNTKVDGLIGWRMAIFYENPTPMFLNDENGICTDVNKAWSELTGLPKAYAIGHGYEKIIHPDDLARLRYEGINFIKDGNSFESKFRFIHYVTKQEIEVYCTATKVKDSNGKLLSIIGSLKKM